ncbi:3138_t:CDS:2, partial [Ambispora leptoticha]
LAKKKLKRKMEKVKFEIGESGGSFCEESPYSHLLEYGLIAYKSAIVTITRETEEVERRKPH